jgi:hypothetical protein
MPTAVGTTWVHTDGTRHKHLTVTKVADGGGGVKLITVRDVSSPTRQRVSEIVAVSQKGLAQVQVMDRRLDPPFWLLKLPSAEGDRWHVGEGRQTVTMTAYPVVPVEVPAGRYTAVQVDYASLTSKGKPYDWTAWFAPGVGRIKERRPSPDGTPEDWVLKSFTPGK